MVLKPAKSHEKISGAANPGCSRLSGGFSGAWLLSSGGGFSTLWAAVDSHYLTVSAALRRMSLIDF
jgi:hypothetical protein